MADDNYTFASLPLPPLPPFGGNALNNALSSSSPDAPNIPVASYIDDPSPFPGVGGDGGGGGGSGSCADPFAASTLNVSTIKLNCTDGTSEITNSHINLDDDAGSTASFDAPAGKVSVENANGEVEAAYTGVRAQVVADGTDWLSILYSDFDITKDVQIKLQELDVCHMGSPGFRKFVAGDSYA